MICDRAELFPLVCGLVGIYSRNRHVEGSIRLIYHIEYINTQCRRSQRVAGEGLQGFALVESHIVYFLYGARQGYRNQITVKSKCAVINRVDTLRQHYLLQVTDKSERQWGNGCDGVLLVLKRNGIRQMQLRQRRIWTVNAVLRSTGRLTLTIEVVIQPVDQHMFAPQGLVCRFGIGQGAVVAYELFLLIGQRVVCLAGSVDLLLALVGVSHLADGINQVDDVLHLCRNHLLKHCEHNPAQTADVTVVVH